MTMIEKITEAIVARGLTQDAVERAALLPKGRISKWISGGQGEPTARQLWRIAGILGYPIDYFLNEEATPPRAANDLSEDERTVIDVYRSLSLTKKQALFVMSWYAGFLKALGFAPGEEIPERKPRAPRKPKGHATLVADRTLPSPPPEPAHGASDSSRESKAKNK